MSDIAKRFQSVTDMTERAAMRNARTSVTGAENAGRIDSYMRAQNMGIKMKQMWMATLDGRTRDSHAIMDGEQQEVGKKFSNGCRYPGDPHGSAAEVYNCRCTLVAMVEGAEPYNPNLRPSEYLKEGGLTYEQWKDRNLRRDDIDLKNLRKSDVVTNPYEDEFKTKGHVGLSGEESDDFMQEHHNKKILGKRGLNTMDGARSERINNALRNGMEIEDEKDRKFAQELDSEIQKNQLPNDMTLFRGCTLRAFESTGAFDKFQRILVDMDAYRDSEGRIDYTAWGKAYAEAEEKNNKNLLELAKQLIGAEIQDDGFMHVSVSSERSIFVASEVNLQIHVPGGTKAYISDYKEESEVILQRGTKLKILGAEITEVKLANGNLYTALQLIAEVI